MKRPVAALTRPSPIVASLGGGVGTLLLGAGIYLAPVLGLPFIDFPRLVGGLFADSPQAAFWLGWALMFVAGAGVFPLALAPLWPLLPGASETMTGAFLKSVLWGLGLFVLGGLALPAVGALNRVEPAIPNPGFFALGYGWQGLLEILLGHLAYGLALGAVLGMSHGIGVLSSLGWVGYGLAGEGARQEEGQA